MAHRGRHRRRPRSDRPGGREHWGLTGGGFDCSGLLIHAFHKAAGITLPRISQPMDGSGNRTDRADVQPGGSLEKSSAATAAIACREPAN
ncbi:NlpC/P60 family protein [Streptomyces parvus]|uniref:NlpC/P60 family protein n=1 Tax=unclassified Streptomyces TaxID=2593676 RepID=UPI001C313853|nr:MULTISPECIES: NlpC/P60 family protein [unclassified Streptomyces]